MKVPYTPEQMAAVPELVGRLYAVVGELEALFGRRFTPDGHLVGSLGEVLGAFHYGLQLQPASHQGTDAIARDGRAVEIKATQATEVALRSCPEHLLVLHLHADGTFTERYNGPGALAWAHAGKLQSNGQRKVSLSRLTRLMREVPESSRLARVLHPPGS